MIGTLASRRCRPSCAIIKAAGRERQSFLLFFSGLFPQHPRGSLCTALRPQTAAGIASASASTHGEAAVGGSRLPARVGEDLVQPASTTLPSWRQLEEGCCEGSLRCDSEDAAPSHDPRCPGSSPERGRHLRCARSRQQAEEGGGFGSPPAAYFHPEHHQAAAARPLQLGISLALFAARSLGKNDAGAGISVGAGLAVPAEGADERGINCELLPMPQGQRHEL